VTKVVKVDKVLKVLLDQLGLHPQAVVETKVQLVLKVRKDLLVI
jgi:hypothetical protein